MIARDIMHLASEVADNCEKGNSIFPSSDLRKELREKHLLEARASLMALDVHMARVYSILIKNPQGCFTSASGNTISSEKAINKLDKMAMSLGTKIDEENRMLTALIGKVKKS